ncbi:MAG: protein kinase domain-containing protein [Chromatiales bacterium]
MIKVLIIDDSRVVRKMMVEAIRTEFPGAAADEYDPLIQGFPGQDFGWSYYDIVFLDYHLGLTGEDGLTWLKKFRAFSDMPPVVILTEEERVNIIVKAIKLGAKDYMLKKDLKGINLSSVVYRALGIEGEDTDWTSTVEDRLIEVARAECLVSHNVAGGDEVATTRPAQGEENSVDPAHGEYVLSRRAGTTKNQLRAHVPGYRLITPIAQGGMSTIFLAQRIEDDLEVVLKLLFTNLNQDDQLLRYFMQEYALISKLNHPYVIKIFERAFATDFAYIAMEYLAAGNLATRIRKGLSEEKSCTYLRQMAEGLRAVHNLGIVHRDLKPANVLFRHNDTVAISDFGVAQFSAASHINEEDVMVGSPSYMSPEQCKRRPVDPRSDLYSLGVIFYEMLTGSKPFPGKTVTEIIDAHLRASVPRLPEPVMKYQPLVDGLMAKDPSDRFQSAAELIAGVDWIGQV